MNLAGARIAREVAGDRFVAGLGRAAQRDAVAEPEGRRPVLPHAHLRPGQGGVRRADARRSPRAVSTCSCSRRSSTRSTRRRRSPRRARTSPQLPLWISATIVDRSGPDALGADDRGVLGLGRARRAADRRRSTARSARARCAPTSPTSRTSRPCLVSAHPNAGLPNAFGGYDETPEVTSTLLGEFARAGPPERRRELLRLGARAHGRDRRRRARASRRASCPSMPHRPRWSGLEPFEIGPDTGFVLIGERTNVTGSARFRRPVEARRLRRRGRGGARAGARRRERARREHGRRPARERGGDAHVPQRDRDRARGRAAADDGRQLPLERASRRGCSRSRARASSTRSASRRARSRSSSRRAGSATTAPPSS